MGLDRFFTPFLLLNMKPTSSWRAFWRTKSYWATFGLGLAKRKLWHEETAPISWQRWAPLSSHCVWILGLSWFYWYINQQLPYVYIYIIDILLYDLSVFFLKNIIKLDSTDHDRIKMTRLESMIWDYPKVGCVQKTWSPHNIQKSLMYWPFMWMYSNHLGCHIIMLMYLSAFGGGRGHLSV